ncbi:EAL domain-containing protein [Frigidibacter oleivorans]|uniref:EAL domain-containing protein n=1 Tax=Frigidibacter oleivorans TaxID=2487129 RepID=UPI000F8DEAC7|nr:EAL domain-containing protein [Frigidibacter oleivorans]
MPAPAVQPLEHALLARAISACSFDLIAQPIVALQGPNLRREYEVLVELRLPDGALLPTSDAVQQAEGQGLMPALDLAIVARVLGHAADLAAHPEVDLSINLSSVTVSGAGGDGVEAMLRGSGVPPQRLQFELTESAALSAPDRACDLLARLRRMGCRIALDDFGTGRSNFWRARNLPVDCLKLDGSFMRDCLQPGSHDQLIVRQVRDYAAKAGMTVVAEQVDRPDLVPALAAEGIDKAQGFALGQRMPLAAVFG